MTKSSETLAAALFALAAIAGTAGAAQSVPAPSTSPCS